MLLKVQSDYLFERVIFPVDAYNLGSCFMQHFIMFDVLFLKGGFIFHIRWLLNSSEDIPGIRGVTGLPVGLSEHILTLYPRHVTSVTYLIRVIIDLITTYYDQ